MKSASVKKRVLTLVLCAALLLAGCIWMTVRYRGEQKEMIAVYAGWPAIRSEAELKQALSGAPTDYRLLDLPATGETVASPSPMLSGRYLLIEVYSETCHDDADPDSHSKHWSGYKNKARTGQLLLCGQYPVEGELHYALRARRPDAYASGTWDDSNRYYPKGKTGNFDGNKRYTFRYLLDGENVSLLAKVGDGRIVASTIYGKATVTDRASNEAVAQGHLVLPSSNKTLAIVLGVAAGLILILSIVVGIRGSKKKTARPAWPSY